jgi:hypothetical protein
MIKASLKNYKGNESVVTHSSIFPLYSGFLSPETKYLHVSVCSIFFCQYIVNHIPSFSIHPSFFGAFLSSCSLWFPL